MRAVALKQHLAVAVTLSLTLLTIGVIGLGTAIEHRVVPLNPRWGRP